MASQRSTIQSQLRWLAQQWGAEEEEEKKDGERERTGRERRKEGGPAEISKQDYLSIHWWRGPRVEPTCGQISSCLDQGLVILKCPNKPGIVAYTRYSVWKKQEDQEFKVIASYTESLGPV